MLRSFVLVLCISLCIAIETVENAVSITPWQYCQGCKETVNLFAGVSAKALAKMQKDGKGEESMLEVQTLISMLCDNEELDKFDDFVKMSCIKIMDEKRLEFLKSFEGSSSAAMSTSKDLVFQRRKSICVDKVEACKAEDFLTVTPDKSKCSACMVIAQDIAKLRRLSSSNENFEEVLEYGLCNNLGYDHSPYSWLENVCEEMIDDKLDDIMGVLRFHDKILKTGLAPSQTMPEMMCSEFFKCKFDKKEL